MSRRRGPTAAGRSARPLVALAATALLAALGACSGSGSAPSRGYLSRLELAQLLETASPLAQDWATHTGSGGSSWSSGHWELESVEAGTFRCAPEDLAALAADFDRVLRDDLFGAGFQLVEERCVLGPVDPAASPSLWLELDVEDRDGHATLALEVTPGPAGGDQWGFDVTLAAGSD